MKMKKIGTYTARGIVSEDETTAGTPQRVFLFDGSNKTAYKVTNFRIWSSNYASSSAPDVIGKLSKNDIGSTSANTFMRADDDNQIAWSCATGATDAGGDAFGEVIIDRENLVVEDLFVYARTSASNVSVNYLIEMDKYEIDGWRGTLEMARDQFDGE